MSPAPVPSPAAASLADCLARLAVSAPLAQGSLDAGSTPSGQGAVPGLVLSRLSVDFAWAVTSQTSLGARVGLRGLPLNANLAVLHGRLADSAARIRFEVQQTPADPASSTNGHGDSHPGV
jgi:hypothetical protein